MSDEWERRIQEAEAELEAADEMSTHLQCFALFVDENGEFIPGRELLPDEEQHQYLGGEFNGE